MLTYDAVLAEAARYQAELSYSRYMSGSNQYTYFPSLDASVVMLIAHMFNQPPKQVEREGNKLAGEMFDRRLDEQYSKYRQAEGQ